MPLSKVINTSFSWNKYNYFILYFILFSTSLLSQSHVKVVRVIDGDTFHAIDSDKKYYKIRLASIDAPERKQSFGTKSRSLLNSLVYGKWVVLDKKSNDRYGRIIAQVYRGKSVHINSIMLSKGMAWHYRKYSTNSYLQTLEDNARKLKIGLWSESNPTPPWNFRKP